MKLTSLKSLKTLTSLARRIEFNDSMGIKLIATITKSKTFHGDLKKSRVFFSATNLIIISIKKTVVIK